jgi:hypothetical protein
MKKKMSCPVCGKPVDRMQRPDPARAPSLPKSIYCAYPCNDWLTWEQAAAVADEWRRLNDPGATATTAAAGDTAATVEAEPLAPEAVGTLR